MEQKALGLKRTLLCILSLLFFAGALVPSAAAQVFNTEVRVILASNSDRGFDPRLLDLKRDLLALNYMSFQLVDETGLSLQQGMTGKVNIPGTRVLELTPENFKEGKIEMKVRVVQGGSSLLKTRIRIENHGTVIIGGPPYASGFLVLAVTAHF